MKKEMEHIDIRDILMDAENKDAIMLVNERGENMVFEQVAVIPYDEKLYCILKPINHIDGIEDDEAIVFYVEEREGKEASLEVETDELKALDVFEKYYDLLEEERLKKGGNL